MSEEQGGRRAKRRCARNKYTSSAMPSAIHYVGYVEDDETPEMIMAKFAELERIKATAAGAAKAAKAAAAAAAAGLGPAAGGAGEADGPQQQQQQQQELRAQQQQQRETQIQEPGQQLQQLETHRDGSVPPQPGGGGGDSSSSGGGGSTHMAAVAAEIAAALQQQHAEQKEAEAAEEEEGGLTEEQLLEVFKQTSMFNVRTALQGNHILMGIDEILEHTSDRYADEEAVSDDEDMLRAFWSDEEGDALLSDGDEEGEGGRRARNRRRGGGGMSRQGSGAGQRLQRSAACMRAKHNVITAFNPVTQALVRRKVQVGSDRGEEIYHLRVPPAPLPVSWGRTVAPYVPAHKRGEREMAVPVPPALLKAIQEGTRSGLDAAAMQRCTYRQERSIPAADWASILQPSSSGGGGAGSSAGGSAGGSSGGGFQAVLINPGWECEGRGDAAVQRLAKLPMRRLVPKGFVFVFVEKQHIQALCRQMRSWGYCYIENLTWVYLRPSHSILELAGRYANRSHLTLYIFRREGEGRDIELRHQRNPDVTFDCLAGEAAGRRVPEEVFVAVETLLPTGKGRFLELWAPPGVRRPGWTHLAEVGGGGGPDS